MKTNSKFFIVLIIIAITMTGYMTKKEGFHEDEMFSYGSSNYKYDNVYRQYGREDEVNTFLETTVIGKNLSETIKNLKHYFIDAPEEKDKIIAEIESKQKPTWRTSKEANEYISIQKEDVLNYPMVYYNQARDVHPPLFYFLVHTVSIFFFGTFSKYIIFIINIIFLIASLYTIKKIMTKMNKEYLAIPVILLYGLSMGAISTVMFQRMYMMLTYFILEFLSINLDIIKNDYEIDKKTWIKLGIIVLLGFLTQYYFCIIAALIALIIFVNIVKKKNKNDIIKYVLNYIKIALIGVIIFPFSIQQIFFSYRGVPSFNADKNFGRAISQYINSIAFSFSIPSLVLLIGTIILATIVTYKLIKTKTKRITEILIFTVPYILYTLLIIKIAPELPDGKVIRYIMCIIPVISMVLALMIDKIINNKKNTTIVVTAIAILLATCGFIKSKPLFLYEGYSKYIEVAQENKEKKFVFIGNAIFNQIQNMQEFAIYDESLALNGNQIDVLKNDPKINETDEFILSIKKYLGAENLLNQVLEKTGFSQYEVLVDDPGDVGCIIYKIKK